MREIRAAAVAGSFYPADKYQLSKNIEELFLAAEERNLSLSLDAQSTSSPKAIIAPHAGFIYSGPIAASLYSKLNAEKIKTVVLLGPSHHVGFKGIAASSKRAYQTPLGLIEIDTAAVESIISLPATGYLDDAHEKEHSLEVHLPFLQKKLGEFKLIPLVIGDASKEDVAAVLKRLWGGDETLIIVSSDLSHFHDYDKAKRIDQETSRKICQLQTDLTADEACGCRPINGLLHFAKQEKLTVHQIDVRNSGDTAGNRDRVVGYGAYSLMPNSRLTTALRQQIIQTARQAIFHTFQASESFNIDLDHYSNELKREGACFITLNLNDQLRGCIGSLLAHRLLIVDVAHNAQAAAFKDPRFQPLTLKEYFEIEVHASILSKPEKLNVNSMDELISVIRPGIDGLVIEEQGKKATYLPSVWQQLSDPRDFITELRKKAGLTPDTWNQCTVKRYSTEEFT